MVNLIKTVNKGKYDSDSSESLCGWKKGTTEAERLYVLGAAQTEQNCSDSDISIDSRDGKKYLKRLRRQKKHRKGRKK